MKKTGFMVLALAIIAVLAASSIAGTAFAHSHLAVTPDASDHGQMNANPVVLTLGHR
jgi:hypothetical protein